MQVLALDAESLPPIEEPTRPLRSFAAILRLNAAQDGDIGASAVDALVEGPTAPQWLRDTAGSCAAEAETAGAVRVGGQTARRTLFGGFEALFDGCELDFESTGKGQFTVIEFWGWGRRTYVLRS